MITHEKSVVKVKFVDGSDILLFEKSSIRIKEYLFKYKEKKIEKSKIEENKNDFGLNAVLDKISGVSRFFIRREHERTNKVILQTGNSVLGIRGTGGFLTVQGDALTRLVVTSGKVELKNLNAAHKSILVGENQWGEIIGDISPTTPKTITPEMLNQLESLIPENFETTQSDYNSNDESEVDEENQEQTGVLSETIETIDMSQQTNKLQEESLPSADKTAEVSQAATMKPFFWKIGPTVSQGLFNFWSFGLETRLSHMVGLSVNFGGADNVNVLQLNKLLGSPIETNKNGGKMTGYKASFKHQEVRLVLYPFAGSFFIGAAVGNRDLDGRPNVEINVSNQLTQIAGYYRVKNKYVAPQFGWFAIFDSGFSIGTELGVQIPITKGSVAKSITINSTGGVSVSNITSSAAYDDLVKNLDKFVNYFQNKTIPFWNIIKIGWLF